MRICNFLFLFFLFPSGLYAALEMPKEAQLVAATVAKVGENKFVTMQDVKLSKIIEDEINSTQSLVKDNVVIAQDDVSKTVLEYIISNEAQSFKYEEYDAKILQKVLKALEGSEKIRKININDKKLAETIKRKLVARSFLALRSDNLHTIIRDEEVRLYYEKNRNRFSSMPFDQFKTMIREFLSKEQLKEKLQEWFEVLKAKYRVRIYDLQSQNPQV